MLADATPVAFVLTTDYARARAFYEGVLGLPVLSQDGFALMLRTGAGTLRVVKMDRVTPAPGTTFGFDVPDVRAAVAWLKSRGAIFERFEAFGDAQDDDGVWTPLGSTHGVAWFKDPDGNVLSVSGPAQ